jgi:hypothetical protein
LTHYERIIPSVDHEAGGKLLSINIYGVIIYAIFNFQVTVWHAHCIVIDNPCEMMGTSRRTGEDLMPTRSVA